MRPRSRSYGESSTFTRSPGLMRIRYRRIRPDVYASVSWPLSSSTRYWPERNDSSTSPSNSTFASFSAISPPEEGAGAEDPPHPSLPPLRDGLDVLRLVPVCVVEPLEGSGCHENASSRRERTGREARTRNRYSLVGRRSVADVQ